MHGGERFVQDGRMTNPGSAPQAATAAASADPHWVERTHGITLPDFVARYRKPRRPVVLTDALRGWPALERFTPDFFRREFGGHPVRIRGRDYRLGEVIEMQQTSSAEHPAPYPCTLSDCDGLLADVSPRFECSLPSRHDSALIPKHVFELVNHLEIFFGSAGGEFPYLHYDMLRMHSWIAQVYGDKEFTLYERGQEELLYVHPEMPWVSRVDDLHDEARYPKLAQAHRHAVVVHAGEALFIPCGIWHTARCVTTNITVAFDQLESSNWREFVGEVVFEERRSGHRWKARVLQGYLGVLGPLFDAMEWFGAHRRADWGKPH